MGILKIYNKDASVAGKLVGAILPQQIVSYLSLYALANETTKSMILREQMETWQKAKLRFMLKKDLIEIIIKKAKHYWLKRTDESQRSQLDMVSFKKDLELQLYQKGIDENDISAILIGLNL